MKTLIKWVIDTLKLVVTSNHGNKEPSCGCH